jgi:hypothetical protein
MSTRRRAIVAATALAAVAACSGPAASQIPAGSPTPRPPLGEAAEINCAAPLELRGPDGRLVNLTGVWGPLDAAQPDYNIRQINNCFFLSGIGAEEPPEYYEQSCDGVIGADFVITARCIDFRQFPVGQPDMGREFFKIEFADGGWVELARCLAVDEPATCEEPIVPWAPAI